MRAFEPWKGDLYESEGIRGLRVFILGESHYGREGADRADFTQHIITKCAMVRETKRQFFTRIQRMVLGDLRELTDADRTDFWHRVVFYNFVQSIVSENTRVCPSRQMWQEAQEPFLQTLSEFSTPERTPHMILILGQHLNRHVPTLPIGMVRCVINHPSSFGFAINRWLPKVQDALTTAREKISVAG